MNLLKETLEYLRVNKKSPADVLWVGSKDFCFSWEEFEKIADVEYNAGYGAPEVAQDLMVVGEDFWLERFEYDGAESWDFKSSPKKPEKSCKPIALTIGGAEKNGFKVSCGWENLCAINNMKEEST